MWPQHGTGPNSSPLCHWPHTAGGRAGGAGAPAFGLQGIWVLLAVGDCRGPRGQGTFMGPPGQHRQGEKGKGQKASAQTRYGGNSPHRRCQNRLEGPGTQVCCSRARRARGCACPGQRNHVGLSQQSGSGLVGGTEDPEGLAPPPGAGLPPHGHSKVGTRGGQRHGGLHPTLSSLLPSPLPPRPVMSAQMGGL
ncbi:uncharacterized protein LOC117085025 [Trachypithecus francoisi]|uniref:uncharacterized protein LOC117085025 n=1 Tax=Trachypithecus francoisi TaxID=54180 RepID=UPI00141A716F|nr:uncharacterized protein LOC117085025 [Trachypithecus francoisi]